MADADDLIRILSLRHEILRSLLDEPKERRVLLEAVDGSRTTVYEGVSQLRARGLIERTMEGFRATQFGAVALERYDEMARTADLEALLADLPPGAIDPAALVGAEAVLPDERSLDRHFVRVERTLRAADSIRGFSPLAADEHVDILRDRVLDDRLSVELVLADELVDHLASEHRSGFVDVLSAGTVEVYRTDAEMPMALLVVTDGQERSVHVDLGQEGVATGLVVNDTAASLRWAEEAYEAQRRRAERVTPGAFGAE